MSTSHPSASGATQPAASGASQPAASHPTPAASHPTVGSTTQPARSHLAAGGAPQPAALTQATRRLIDDLKAYHAKFGRCPKQIKRKSSELTDEERAENKLAKRWSDQHSSIPDNVESALRELGISLSSAHALIDRVRGAPQLASSRSAPQPAALSAAQRKLADEIRQLGRVPQRS